MQRHKLSLVTLKTSWSAVSKDWKKSGVEKGKGSTSHNKQREEQFLFNKQ